MPGRAGIGVVRCRFRPTTLPMRRIRLFALVVAVSAAILPAASARAGDPITLYGSGWGMGSDSPMGCVRVGGRRLDVDADPHPLLQRQKVSRSPSHPPTSASRWPRPSPRSI